jgi:hypothetical protein
VPVIAFNPPIETTFTPIAFNPPIESTFAPIAEFTNTVHSASPEPAPQTTTTSTHYFG